VVFISVSPVTNLLTKLTDAMLQGKAPKLRNTRQAFTSSEVSWKMKASLECIQG